MYDARPAHQVMIGAGTAKDLSSTGVFAYTWNFLEPAEIRQLACKVTVVLVATGGAVVTFRRRPAYGSAGSGATAQTTLGTVTIGVNAAADTVWVNNITPVVINPGDQIVADVTTAASASGSAIAYLVHCFSPEVSRNESKVTVVTA
jgi:hypothetical protein